VGLIRGEAVSWVWPLVSRQATGRHCPFGTGPDMRSRSGPTGWTHRAPGNFFPYRALPTVSVHATVPPLSKPSAKIVPSVMV